MITINGIKREINLETIRNLVKRRLSEYTEHDQTKVVECTHFLIEDLEVYSEDMHGNDFETYYTNAVIEYLNDKHAVFDLENLEDSTEVFNYL